MSEREDKTVDVTIDSVDDQSCNLRVTQRDDLFAQNFVRNRSIVLEWLKGRGEDCLFCVEQVQRREKTYVGHPPVSRTELSVLGITLPDRMTTIVQYRFTENGLAIGANLGIYENYSDAVIPRIGEMINLQPVSTGYAKVAAMKGETKADPIGTAEKRFITLILER